jgi:hypothetical protein
MGRRTLTRSGPNLRGQAKLSDVDPESQTFRYARDRKGVVNLDGPRNINMAHVAAVMQKVALVLDGAADGMDEMMRFADR